MYDHPTPAELEAFVWNRMPAGRSHEIVLHLLLGCEPCRAVLTPHLEGMLGLADPPERVLTAAEDTAYDAALDRAFATASRRAEELREKGTGAAALLVAAGPEGFPEMPEHLRTVPVFEALLERSWSLRHENPEEMVRLANWARFLADKLDPETLGTEAVNDLRCRAWIELGNAHRVADDLAEAETALSRAADLFVLGSRDELLSARLFDVQASLYSDSRRFDLAETALDFVFAIHRRRGDTHLAGRALISKGTFVGYRGEAEEAIDLLQQGLDLVDGDREPRLVLAAIHNQARLLVDSGRHREARMTLWKLKARGIDLGGQINELKVRWLEAQINVGMGELDRAEQALFEVKQGFEEGALGYKAALAGLELGAVLLRQGKTRDSIREVLAAADVFIALGISREAGASLLLLRKTFELNMADMVLLEYVIGLLRRAENEPEARFEPPAAE
ncbi:MAG TPA: hypothetical protein VKK31_24490 [Thermoanaerobaculia bacterium]|nr:hypothetical protein [Thermoanaerobaculia bacterium]